MYRHDATIDGVHYTMTYRHDSGLPELCGRWWKPGRDSKTAEAFFARGSSLGPANPDCPPNAEDKKYWESVAAGSRGHAARVAAICAAVAIDFEEVI